MEVEGSQGDVYIVAIDQNGKWACSCPAWKFHRAPKVDCKHINATKAGLRRREEARASTGVRVGLFARNLDFDVGAVDVLAPSGAVFAALDYTIRVQ